MSKTLLLITAAIAAMSMAACSKPADKPPSAATPDEKAATPDANPAATIPTAANEAAAPDFVAKAAASDMFEVAAGKLAASQASNPEVKKFAAMMVAAHTRTTAALKAAIAKAGAHITPPATLPADLRAKLDDLKGKAGNDFDRAYMRSQVDGHQAALDLFQRYAQDGDVADIKTLAAATAPTIQEHLTKAKGVLDGLPKA